MEPIATVSEATAPSETAPNGNMVLGGLVALLGVVALGGAGFMLMRRRKPAANSQPEIELTEAQIMEPARPANVPPTRTRETPAYRAPPQLAARATVAPRDASGNPISPFVYNPIYQGKRPEERPVFTMPAGPVPTGEARTARLNRMVASRPDSANPFTSTKWRMRRARVLLSKREKVLSEQATRPFDFRDFSTHVPIKPYRPAKPPLQHMA